MGTTFSVSNATELQAAIDTAEGGDRIVLAAGNYGELNLKNELYDGTGVTITSADPNNVAVFDKVTLYGCENMHFDTIEIDFEPTGNTGYEVGFRASEGSDISITNSILHGGFDETRTGDDADSPIGVGVQLYRVDNIVVENNEIYDFHKGIVPTYVDGLSLIDNHIYDIRTSPVTGGSVSNVEITGNHFESSAPVNFGGAGDHADMIHFYPLINQTEPMENIIIRDNFFEQGTSEDAILGIYLDDSGSGGSGIGYLNVVIDNNIIHNGNAQGLRTENVDGLTITNNSFLQSSGDGASSAPGILLTDGTQNVVIDNNIVAGYFSGTSFGESGAGLNIQIGDNLFVQNRDPFGENYVGNLFTNGLTANGDMVDFTPMVGSAAEGYGSTLSNFFAEPGDHAAVILDTPGEGIETKTIHFDAEALFSAYHQVNLDGAKLAWDFGDGTTGNGNNINHTYESAGTYEVTATFTLANGRVLDAQHTVDVFTSDAVLIDFEDGVIEDDSDFQNVVETSGDYTLESSRFGDALRLVNDSSRVVIEQNTEILDNPEFSISFAFQKDGGTASNDDNGMFSYFSGTSYISTGEGTLRIGGGTSTGRSITLEADAAQIEDGAWHHLTYTFSSENGTAVMYLDGEEVDRMEGLTGIQSTTSGHDLLLGGRVSGSFGGLMDEVEFTRAALTSAQVADRYDDLFNPTEGSDGTTGNGGNTADTGGEALAAEEPSVISVRPGADDTTTPVPTVTVCEDPVAPSGSDLDPNTGLHAEEDPLSGLNVMPAPVVVRDTVQEPEEEAVEEAMPRPFAQWASTSAAEENSTVYDSILNSIASRDFQRSEEGEPMSARAEPMLQESVQSPGFFRLFDILRDTGKLDENVPPAEEEIRDEEDVFSFLF